jgi:hypothetical protein
MTFIAEPSSNPGENFSGYVEELREPTARPTRWEWFQWLAERAHLPPHTFGIANGRGPPELERQGLRRSSNA